MNNSERNTSQNDSPLSPQETLTGKEWSRRSFLKIMGLGALGTAWSLSSCRSPGRYIVPYKTAPEWSLPGKPTLYATSFPSPWGGIPLLATSHEGRPTMLEPNPKHPQACGSPTYTTASLWDLYSPDRSRTLLFHGKKVAEGEVMGPAEFAGAFRAWSQRLRNKEACAIVLENQDSPTLRNLLRRLTAINPQLRLYQDDQFVRRNATIALSRFYQRPICETLRFEHAERILSLDCDFLGLDIRGNTTAFFDKRIPAEKNIANRLYSLESAFTLTGGIADHRLPIVPERMESLMSGLAAKLVEDQTIPNAPSPLSTLAEWVKKHPVPALTPQEETFLKACAQDLREHQGKALILLGDSYPVEWHELVHLCNLALSATTQGMLELYPDEEALPLHPLSELKKDLSENRLSLLFWLSPGDPVFSQPEGDDASLTWKKLLASPGLDSVHWGLYTNATAHACTWHIPASHFLESWGDIQSPDQILSFIQPLILPLFGGVGALELLMGLMGKKGVLTTADTAPNKLSPAYSAVKTTFTRRIPGSNKNQLWLQALKNGFAALPRPARLALKEAEYSPLLDTLEERLPAPSTTSAPTAPSTPTAPGADAPTTSNTPAISTVLFSSSYATWDGRYLNNAWMQECPDPLTKLTWGNAALISPTSRKKLDSSLRKTGIRLSLKNGKSLELPLRTLPGLPEGLLILPRGYGQTACGLVGENCGVDVNGLLPNPLPWFSSGIPSEAANYRNFFYEAIDWEGITPALAQQEDSMQNVPLIRREPTGQALPAIKGEDTLHQWGMCIDLSKCTGCNACVLACQAENNIPLVGRDQVANSRLMHWLRVDRYFEEKSGCYDALMQPVACQQCENAPCESVCPLSATAHTPDGLNAMAYPRCAGTRYCANNCPYKVRRFNYFDFNKYNPFLKNNLAKGPWGETQTGSGPHLQRNPNVTVRMRGIMEKCTYCVQRIEAAKIRQKRAVESLSQQQNVSSPHITLRPEDLRIPADSFTCACQAACPAGAITFGNLLDKEKAAVYRARTSPRAYTLLDHLGVHPRTAYLTRQRNPNPNL